MAVTAERADLGQAASRMTMIVIPMVPYTESVMTTHQLKFRTRLCELVHPQSS